MRDATNAEKAAHEHQHENTSLADLAGKYQTTSHEIRAALNEQYPTPATALKQQVLNAYQDTSRSTRSILTDFNISQDTLNRWTLEHGLRRQPKDLSPNRRQEAALTDYRDSSITITEAAQRHGITPATLSRWAQRFGVEREPQEDPRKLAITHEYHRTRHKPDPPSLNQLAKRHGVPPSTARTWLKNQAIPPRPHPVLLTQAQVISAYQNTSHPIRLIAKEHGISIRTAWRYLEGVASPPHRETRSRARKSARLQPES